MKVTTSVTMQTLLGGDDDNCFSLARRGHVHRSAKDYLADPRPDVRVVNMRLGPFRRAAAEFLKDGLVEVGVVAPGIVTITDPRVPARELNNDGWCTVCCPFRFLPEAQQRDRLRWETPDIRDGVLVCWSCRFGPGRKDNTPEQIEAWLKELRAIGAA